MRKRERRTSGTEHRPPKWDVGFSIRRSVFDVRCSTFLLPFALALCVWPGNGVLGAGHRDPAGTQGQEEPTVGPAEAELLREAQKLAEANVQAAIGRLEAARDPEGSAALVFALGCLYAQNEQPALAERCFVQVLQRLPRFQRARQNLANVLAQQSKYDAAARELAEVLKQDPGSLKARFTLAGVLAGQEKHAEATAQLRALLALKPGPQEEEKARRMLAAELAVQSDFDQAAAELIRVLELNPDEAQTRRTLVGVLIQQRQFGQAVTHMRRLLESDPGDHEMRQDLARVLLQLEDRDGAIIELQGLLERTPEDSEVRRLLADVLLQTNRLDEAADVLRGLLAQDPQQHEARESLAGLLLQQGKLAEATKLLQQLVERKPDAHKGRLNLANALLQQQDYTEAIRQLNALVDSDYKEKEPLWRLLGFAYRCADSPIAAEQAYRNALRYAPDSQEVRMGLVRSLLDQGDVGAARRLILADLQREPHQADLWRLLVNADLAEDQDFDALVRLECARRFDLADQAALLTTGDLFLEQRLPDEALARYLEAVKGDSVPVDRLLKAADAFVKLGQAEEASRLLAAIREAPSAVGPEQQRALGSVKARAAAATGDDDEALRLYRELLDAAPLDPDILMETADLLRRTAQPEEARSTYQCVARNSEEHRPMALVRQAQIAVEQEKYKEAVGLLEQSLDLRHRPFVERYLEQVRRMLE